MNWRELLNGNLSLLGYDLACQLAPNMAPEKARYSQNIILYLIKKFNSELYDELMRFVSQSKEKQIYRDYIRKLHIWCSDTISRTFVNYSFNNTILLAAQTDEKLEEMLARLSTSCLSLSAQHIAGGTMSLRFPISCLELQNNNLSPELALSVLKEDFNRETRAYLEHLHIFINRKETLPKKSKSILEKIESKRFAVEKLKKEIFGKNYESVIDENDINTVKKRLDESDVSMGTLMEKLENFSNLCDRILEIYFKKPAGTRIDVPELKKIVIGKPNTESLMNDDKLSIDKVIKKTIEELSIDREPLKNNTEIIRVSTVVKNIKNNITASLEIYSEGKDNMTKLLNNLNTTKREEVSDDKTYGSIPTAKLLMDKFRDSVETEDRGNNWESSSPSETGNNDNNQVGIENIEPLDLLRTPPNTCKPKFDSISGIKKSRQPSNTSMDPSYRQSSARQRPLSPMDLFRRLNDSVDNTSLSDRHEIIDDFVETFPEFVKKDKPNFTEALSEIANSSNNDVQFFDRSDDSFLKEINENE